MIKGIFFDFDGVIVDSEVHHTNVTEEFLKKENINIPVEATYALIGGNAKMNTWQLIYENYMDENSEPYESFNKRHMQYFRKRIAETDYSTIIFPDAYETIKTLKEKGYFLALCSSSNMDYLKQKLRECHIDVYFDAVLSGQDFKKSKPDPDIYLTCLKMSGLNKEEVMIIEDSPFGIQAAKASGMKTIVKKDYIFGLDQSNGDYYIDNLSEILGILDKTVK